MRKSRDKKKCVAFARFLWSEGREKKDAGTEGGKDEGMERETDTLRRREWGPNLLRSCFGSAELPPSQLPSDWLKPQRVVD